ncbi:MAG TPA: beta-ketoacyl-ACP synthase III [Clostridia bacterium]|nr:beta-ketoacyl-ACP synthase III [Clostridia bacterium]
MNYANIIGTGTYVPEKIVDNHMLSKLVETSDEWIRARTGIKERRISTGENTSDLALKASEAALENAGISPEDLDMIILSTLTPDYFTPATACLVQRRLGAENAAAFDVSAACSGFLYGLDVADSFIKAGKAKKILVVSSEVMSKVIDWKDRNTCVLFGDGAGAVVLNASAEHGIINTVTGSKGDIEGNLVSKSRNVVNPFMEIPENGENYLSMNGKEIFKFATRIMRKALEDVLDGTGVELNGVKYIVPHQANDRMFEYVAGKMKFEKEKFYVNLERFGNTSSASIPIALDEMAKKGLLSKGDKLIFVGFGGGLTWGAALVEWQLD